MIRCLALPRGRCQKFWCNSLRDRGPKDYINIRTPQGRFSGIPLVLGLSTRTYDPCVSIISCFTIPCYTIIPYYNLPCYTIGVHLFSIPFYILSFIITVIVIISMNIIIIVVIIVIYYNHYVGSLCSCALLGSLQQGVDHGPPRSGRTPSRPPRRSGRPGTPKTTVPRASKSLQSLSDIGLFVVISGMLLNRGIVFKLYWQVCY